MVLHMGLVKTLFMSVEVYHYLATHRTPNVNLYSSASQPPPFATLMRHERNTLPEPIIGSLLFERIVQVIKV